MIKTILWDVGGVLLRTENHMPRLALAEKFGLTCHELEILVFSDSDQHRAQLGKISEEEHFINIANSLRFPEEEILIFKDQFFAGDKIDHEIIAWINSLRLRYQMAILSNAMTGLREALTHKYPINQYFDKIYISAELRLMKPNHAIYQFVMEDLLRKPEEIVFIDDNLENIRVAEELGMFGISFESRTQTLGELKELLSV